MDELGLMARHGQELVVRQTLCGGDYGMIDDQGMVPRPDYWNSLLWKRLMGERVYHVEPSEENHSQLRVYAHATPGKQDRSLTLLAINLDPSHSIRLSLPQFKGCVYQLYRVTSPDLFGKTLLLNEKALSIHSGQLPDLEGIRIQSSTVPETLLHPLSYSFLVLDLTPSYDRA